MGAETSGDCDDEEEGKYEVLALVWMSWLCLHACACFVYSPTRFCMVNRCRWLIYFCIFGFIYVASIQCQISIRNPPYVCVSCLCWLLIAHLHSRLCCTLFWIRSAMSCRRIESQHIAFLNVVYFYVSLSAYGSCLFVLPI